MIDPNLTAKIDDRILDGLAGWSSTLLYDAAVHGMKYKKQVVENRRRYRQVYNPDKLAAIRSALPNGSEAYTDLTTTKCRGMLAAIEDVLYGKEDDVWSIEPTPLPRGQIGAMQGSMDNQVAQDAADEMKKLIDDQLEECGFQDVIKDVITNAVISGSGVLRGPILKDAESQSWSYDSVDILDVYWTADVYDILQGNIFIRHRFNRNDLLNLQEADGFYPDKIRSMLIDLPERESAIQNIALLPADIERHIYDEKGFIPTPQTSMIEVFEFWGYLAGRELQGWGMDEAQEEREYPMVLWYTHNEIIRALILTDLNDMPLHMLKFESIPDVFCGVGLPELLAFHQDAHNEMARALVNNAAMSAGMQLAVNVDMLPLANKSKKDFELRQFGTWFFEGSMSGNQDFFKVYNLPFHATELMGLMNQIWSSAGEIMPPYMTGQGGGNSGASDTASGLAMLNSNANRPILSFASAIDRFIVEPAIRALFKKNMRYSPNQAVKGDIDVVIKGARSKIVTEQKAVRYNELLQILGGNPGFQQTLAQVIVGQMGVQGIGDMMKEIIKNLGLPLNKTFPHVLQQQVQQAQLMGQSEVPGMPIQQQAMNPANMSKELPQTINSMGNPSQGEKIMESAL